MGTFLISLKDINQDEGGIGIHSVTVLVGRFFGSLGPVALKKNYKGRNPFPITHCL